ncbi:hypothetical protein BAMA_15350 [Bacillus manliponensis]|uniref:N-acetyltransferase domain-containing protein n=1 Tax=Bacillus manliponensis TaxID=574376 RepID=A0A073JT22_9BACI|nr:GNAT family N-acetyltransferase [Bacillus manliponensis]KEK17397.1 hypothetical protein BAMA_15350 [Bacillus manliponensis]
MVMHIQELTNEQNIAHYIKEILHLWNENCIETAECELEEADRKAIGEQIIRYVSSPHGVVLLAISKEHEIVGYSIASTKQDLVSNEQYGQIDEVYIAKGWRRKQVANEFVSQIMRFFQQKDICTIYVHVDLENQLAAHFWEGIGFDKEFHLFSHVK